MIPDHRQAGFSLLEVLVALFIAALVCGLAFRVIGVSSQLAVRNQQQLQQLQLAESKLKELTQAPHRWSGLQQGSLGTDLIWRSHVRPAPDVESHRRWVLYLIELQLLQSDGETPLLQFSTLQLGRHP